METDVPPSKSATGRRQWHTTIGLMILATIVVLFWMFKPTALNGVETQLVGTWTPRSTAGSYTLSFHPDRTVSYNNSKIGSWTGEWWANSGSVYWDHGFDDVMMRVIRRTLHGNRDRNKYTLLAVEEDCFRFLDNSGKTYEFIRIVSRE